MDKKEKCSITQKNRIVIHKNELEKRVYINELQEYLDKGWEKGYSDSHIKILSDRHKGKITWNKNKPCSEKTKKKISNSLKGNIPWNKNKKTGPLSEETRKKLSYLKKGRPKSEEHRRKIGESHRGKGFKLSPDKLKIKLSKEYITKKKNNSFNKSDIEEQFYTKLLEENKTKTIYRQYKDAERYPYYCDFYIVEDDLFIEVNAHWTHGGKPYDQNDDSCQEQLSKWQEKAKTSKFYENAIITWTIRDVEKRKCAEKNHINYKVIY